MQRLGFIETEGGPLVLIDSALARFWLGVEGRDYERACEFFDSHPGAKAGLLTVGSGSALVWEMNGPGTADIYKVDDEIVIVRAWLAQNVKTSDLSTLAEGPAQEIMELGEIDFNGNAIVVLWATESGSDIDDSTSTHVQRPQRLNLDNAGLIIPSKPGKYEVKHYSIERAGSKAQRLHLKLKSGLDGGHVEKGRFLVL